MYVCICQSVTEAQIRDAATEGAGTLDELQKCLGVAARCGTCACAAEEILEELRDEPFPRRQPHLRLRTSLPIGSAF